MIPRRLLFSLLFILLSAGCSHDAELPISAGFGPDPQLPPPDESLIPTVNIAPAVGWAAGAKPVAAAGMVVNRFADRLDHPRWLYVLPNGDVLVAETNAPAKPEENGIKAWVVKKVKKKVGAGVRSADRISLLRDTDGDGRADQRFSFLTGLHSPFGMALIGNDLYVANTDGLVRYPYRQGDTRLEGEGVLVLPLPAGPINHHWTKNVIAAPDGSKLYITVGSNSNVAENGIDKEQGRAAIWEVDPATGDHRIFASGLRNPNGMAWEPDSGKLWTVVNERDNLGNNLVPDYMTSVQDGGFYGWPYSYFGSHVDKRVQPPRPDLVVKALVPDYGLGSHTACLGLVQSRGNSLPVRFANGMFIGQHGSWNRSPRSGYKVIFVPFAKGRPVGGPLDVLTGFLTEDGKAQGRPVGVALAKDGSLLAADDVGNIVWRMSVAPK